MAFPHRAQAKTPLVHREGLKVTELIQTHARTFPGPVVSGRGVGGSPAGGISEAGGWAAALALTSRAWEVPVHIPAFWFLFTVCLFKYLFVPRINLHLLQMDLVL